MVLNWLTFIHCYHHAGFIFIYSNNIKNPHCFLWFCPNHNSFRIKYCFYFLTKPYPTHTHTQQKQLSRNVELVKILMYYHHIAILFFSFGLRRGNDIMFINVRNSKLETTTDKQDKYVTIKTIYISIPQSVVGTYIYIIKHRKQVKFKPWITTEEIYLWN